MNKFIMPSQVIGAPSFFGLGRSGILKNNFLFNLAFNTSLAIEGDGDAVVAWGRKSSGLKAHKLSCNLNLPLITVEDGFLRSLVGGVNSKYGASFVADDQGIYFDLNQPNLLQELIFQTKSDWYVDKLHHAKILIDKIIANRLSKYNSTNHAPNLSKLAGNDNKHVIIIDQVKNDASIRGAGACENDFQAMIQTAKNLYPKANIWIKAHPEGKGYFINNTDTGVLYLKEPCNSMALLEQATAVFTVSSHMGFEALMLGKKAHCFGVNWYAGFGLTDDEYLLKSQLYQKVVSHHYELANRYNATPNATIHELFYAAYVSYSHYADPATATACDIETVMDYLILNRDWQERLSQNILAYDFSRWKIPFVRAFLDFPKSNLTFTSKKFLHLVNVGLAKFSLSYDDRFAILPFLKKSDRSYVVWGMKSKRILSERLTKLGENNPKIWCMEDGFIRSNGLGATLIAPLSVVMDDVGIYYDATAPSRLEQILSHISLSDEENQRADKLHQLLITKRVSKYNVATKNNDFIQKIQVLKQKNPNRKIRLVVGQVEDDASVQSCASMIKKNGELLARVRADFPNDVIIYKPHPDVEAGLRIGRIDNAHLSDIVATDVAMPDCLDVCDVVHTISSLTGFEALLRGREVVCYGLPFYAGFGLTVDVVENDNLLKINALQRRQRAPLTLNELIIGTLVHYPLYHLPHGYGLATPEAVIDYLYEQPNHAPKSSRRSAVWQAVKTNAMRLRNFTKRQ